MSKRVSEWMNEWINDTIQYDTIEEFNVDSKA